MKINRSMNSCAPSSLRRSFQTEVDDIVVEYGNSLYQKSLDRYIAGEDCSSFRKSKRHGGTQCHSVQCRLCILP